MKKQSLFEATKPDPILTYVFEAINDESMILNVGNWVTVYGQVGEFFVDSIYDDGFFTGHNMYDDQIDTTVYDILSISKEPTLIYKK